MKTTSKQADDALANLTRARVSSLTSAMQRNTTLATGQGSNAASGPVNTYAPQTVPSAPSKSRRRHYTSGIRFNDNDTAKIREIIQAGLQLRETLSISDAMRLALRAFDPRRMTAADIIQLRAGDGRIHAEARGG